MLTRITIRDFAIIDMLDLELTTGMTVLSGETGAGKSILVDAMGLILGDRADSSMVRHGSEHADISADFEVDEARLKWLAEQQLDADGECLVRRTISAQGRSRAWINGRPVPAQLLRDLSEQLVDIHGQHAHQSLLRPATQRQVLDEYGGHGELLAKVADAHHDWHALQHEHDELLAATTDRASRIDLLRYQSNELEELELRSGEFTELEQERKLAANSSRLIEASSEALEAIYGDQADAALTVLSRSHGRLQALAGDDPRLAPIVELLEGAVIQSQEAAAGLRDYVDGLDIDPARLEALEQRLQRITDLARKHQCEPDQLPALFDSMRAELDGLDNADARLQGIAEQLDIAAEHYAKAAARLSKARSKTAARLGKAVTANMQQLGMVGGRFAIDLQPQSSASAHGAESVELHVSANPGQPLRALAKVASGGELSRIALALQVLISQRQVVPTLVFDEVDVGIGGGVAEMVGRLLRELGDGRQVLCVTHQPQVAAQGHQHLFVSKRSARGNTGSRIQTLTDEARIEELARMLGGVAITDHTRSLAGELLLTAQQGDD